MLVPGHWGDFVITEAPDYLRNDEAPILEDEMRELPERIYLHRDMLGAVTWESEPEVGAIEYVRAELHTMIECANCKRGVRPRNAIRGFCPRCAEELLDVTDKLLTECDRVLDAIPECPAHGPQCVPHAIEWIEDMQAELKRLRGIEKVLLGGQPRRKAQLFLSLLANSISSSFSADATIEARQLMTELSDALEAKP